MRSALASLVCRANGKAALVTMAFDRRFAMGLIASSGAGGTRLFRRNFGESLENLASSGAYHWMAGNYMKYSAEEGHFRASEPPRICPLIRR